MAEKISTVEGYGNRTGWQSPWRVWGKGWCDRIGLVDGLLEHWKEDGLDGKAGDWPRWSALRNIL